jgi:hypothetical protein
MNHIASPDLDEGLVPACSVCGGFDLKCPVGSDGDGGSEELLIGPKDDANLSAEGRATTCIGLQQSGWPLVTQLIEALFQFQEELSEQPVSVNEPV